MLGGLARTSLSRARLAAGPVGVRSLATNDGPLIPRIPAKRDDEKGPGGRASNAGVKVAIFGASGFLGRYVCCNLGTNGVLAYLGNRGDEFEMRWLKPMFDLGRTRFVFYSSRDRDSMAEVIADADIVINLVGKYYETKALSNKESFPYLEYKTNTTFQECNVDVPRTVAELCTEMQVDNLIHVSSAAASPDSSSEWARTKWEGEQAVKEAYPWATVIRPTQLFGPEDKLLNWVAHMAGHPPMFVPLIDGGHALTQPVYMADVADVIARIVDEPEKFEGKTVDCFGPQDYSYKEMVQFVCDITGQEPFVVDVPKSVALNIAKLTQYKGSPQMTPDLVQLWSEDYVPAMTQEEYDAQPLEGKILTMKDFGIEATPMEKIAFRYLHRYRSGGHFQLVEGYQGHAGHSGSTWAK